MLTQDAATNWDAYCTLQSTAMQWFKPKIMTQAVGIRSVSDQERFRSGCELQVHAGMTRASNR